MSTRSERARRRRRQQRKKALGRDQWALQLMRRQLSFEQAQAERKKREDETKRARVVEQNLTREQKAFRDRQARSHQAMLSTIQTVKAREERKAAELWERAHDEARDPMTGMEWSPTSGRGTE